MAAVDEHTGKMMYDYVGVKLVKATPMTLGEYNDMKGWGIPENEDPAAPGYCVKYSEDYISWCPKEVFEKANFYLEDPTKITQSDVERMVSFEHATDIDEKTTLIKANTLTGFVQYETSSCVDPANYDKGLGASICMDRIKNTVWPMMGFVLQWAKNGLK